jgi:hypothetical protein
MTKPITSGSLFLLLATWVSVGASILTIIGIVGLRLHDQQEDRLKTETYWRHVVAPSLAIMMISLTHTYRMYYNIALIGFVHLFFAICSLGYQGYATFYDGFVLGDCSTEKSGVEQHPACINKNFSIETDPDPQFVMLFVGLLTNTCVALYWCLESFTIRTQVTSKVYYEAAQTRVFDEQQPPVLTNEAFDGNPITQRGRSIMRFAPSHHLATPQDDDF